MKIYKDINEILNIVNNYQNSFHVEKVDFLSSSDWYIENGALIHSSKGFFSVRGVEFYKEDKIQKIMLYQPQHAITGLITAVINEERCYLVQARGEPGNVNGIQFGPTVQTTPANYLKLHGGSTTKYVELFVDSNANVNIICESTQLDFGEKYLYKNKRCIIIEISKEIEATENYFWINDELLLSLLKYDNLFNLDLRTLIALLPWNNSFFKNIDFSRGYLSTSNNARYNVVGMILGNVSYLKLPFRFIDINKLDNWIISNEGIYEKVLDQGFSIEFFKVYTKGREVSSWVQPLVNSCTYGKVGLLLKLEDDTLYILVRAGTELGLSTGMAILPSYLTYPGEKEINSIELIRNIGFYTSIEEIRSVLISDEGGRFFRDVSIYELYLVKEFAINKEESFHWVNLNELKLLLSYSNLVSIQLRAITSLLLSIPNDNL